MDVETITEVLGFTRNYWSAVENERRILSEEKMAMLLDLFDFDQDEQQELVELREAAKLRGSRLPDLGLAGDQRVVDDPAKVRDLSLTYGEALRRTIDRKDSLRLIRQCAKEI